MPIINMSCFEANLTQLDFNRDILNKEIIN